MSNNDLVIVKVKTLNFVDFNHLRIMVFVKPSDIVYLRSETSLGALVMTYSSSPWLRVTYEVILHLSKTQ